MNIKLYTLRGDNHDCCQTFDGGRSNKEARLDDGVNFTSAVSIVMLFAAVVLAKVILRNGPPSYCGKKRPTRSELKSIIEGLGKPPREVGLLQTSSEPNLRWKRFQDESWSRTRGYHTNAGKSPKMEMRNFPTLENVIPPEYVFSYYSDPCLSIAKLKTSSLLRVRRRRLKKGPLEVVEPPKVGRDVSAVSPGCELEVDMAGYPFCYHSNPCLPVHQSADRWVRGLPKRKSYGNLEEVIFLSRCALETPQGPRGYDHFNRSRCEQLLNLLDDSTSFASDREKSYLSFQLNMRKYESNDWSPDRGSKKDPPSLVGDSHGCKSSSSRSSSRLGSPSSFHEKYSSFNMARRPSSGSGNESNGKRSSSLAISQASVQKHTLPKWNPSPIIGTRTRSPSPPPGASASRWSRSAPRPGGKLEMERWKASLARYEYNPDIYVKTRPVINKPSLNDIPEETTEDMAIEEMEFVKYWMRKEAAAIVVEKARKRRQKLSMEGMPVTSETFLNWYISNQLGRAGDCCDLAVMADNVFNAVSNRQGDQCHNKLII